MVGRDPSHTLLPTLSGPPHRWVSTAFAQTSIRVLCSVCQSTLVQLLSSPRRCLIIPLSVLSLAQSKDLVAWKARVLPEQVPAGDPATLSLFFANAVFP